MAPMLDVALPGLKTYAARHGYELVVGGPDDAQGRPPAWAKVSLLRSLLEDAEEALWIDADTLIMDDSVDIATQVRQDSFQALVRHRTDNGEVPNTGVWFVRGERGRQFLDLVWQSEQYTNHNWWENAAVIDLLGYSLEHPIKPIRPSPWLGGSTWLNPSWNAVSPWTDTERPRIRHYAGWKWAGLTPDDVVLRMRADATEPDASSYADYHTWGMERIVSRLASLFIRIGAVEGFNVQCGPFSGMAYLPDISGDDLLRGSAMVPKLAGSYEAELWDVVAEIVRANYETIVNVGCGEGYYAVGLARSLPQAHVYAFDTDAQSQRWCHELAELNGVTKQLTIAGECTRENLAAIISNPTLLFVDCEGGELDLLQPDLLPDLVERDVLVEFHDFINPVISETIIQRFSATHDITIINATRRDPADYPSLQPFTPQEQRMAIDEFRPEGMQWAWMKSRRAHDRPISWTRRLQTRTHLTR